MEPTIEQPEINDFTSSSTAHLFEDDLTTIEFEHNLTSMIEENSVKSFSSDQDRVSSLIQPETSSEN